MAKIAEMDIRGGTGVYRIQAAKVAENMARDSAVTYGTDYMREFNHAVVDEEVLVDWLLHKMTLESAGAVLIAGRSRKVPEMSKAEVVDVTYQEEIPA